jgi:hypothetical protein
MISGSIFGLCLIGGQLVYWLFYRQASQERDAHAWHACLLDEYPGCERRA